MAVIKVSSLKNEYGSEYGVDVLVLLKKGEKHQDGINAVCKEFGLDPDDEKDLAYINNGGDGVWNQFHLNILSGYQMFDTGFARYLRRRANRETHPGRWESYKGLRPVVLVVPAEWSGTFQAILNGEESIEDYVDNKDTYSSPWGIDHSLGADFYRETFFRQFAAGKVDFLLDDLTL